MAAMSSDGDSVAMVLGPARRSEDWQGEQGGVDKGRASAARGNHQLSFWRRNGKAGGGGGDAAPAFEVLTRVMFPHGAHSVSALAFNPASAQVCSAGNDGNFKIWAASSRYEQLARALPPGVMPSGDDAESWACQAVGSFRPLPCRAVAYSSDGAVVSPVEGSSLSARCCIHPPHAARGPCVWRIAASAARVTCRSLNRRLV